SEGHPSWGVRLLREKRVAEAMCRAILGHGNYTGVPRDTPLAKTLFAVDELCGFLVACALVRPSRSFADLEVSSVKKKLKDKAFARRVNRDEVRQGAEELGVPLDDHIAYVIQALRPVERARGLGGEAAEAPPVASVGCGRTGVSVRVLYDAFGSLGTSRGYWRGLAQAGAEVRAFHPIVSRYPLQFIQRDHRKLLVTDGIQAMVGGLCIGDEWAGDPTRRRRPWRDTMVHVCGPAAAALDRAFGRIWGRAGEPLPAGELTADPAPCGSSTVRVVEGAPRRARVYRTVELLAASAAERLWITDAYLIAPATLYAGLLDAAKGGVD